MRNVDVDVIKEKINSGEKITLIDVRTPQETHDGMIEGAVNLPLDTFETNIEDVIPDKNETVYLYCLSGSRIIPAANIMEELGYKNIYCVNSGILAWCEKGYPLVRK